MVGTRVMVGASLPFGVVQEGPSEELSPGGAEGTAVGDLREQGGGNSNAQGQACRGPENPRPRDAASVCREESGWGDVVRGTEREGMVSSALRSGDRRACPSLYLGGGSNLLPVHGLCTLGLCGLQPQFIRRHSERKHPGLAQEPQRPWDLWAAGRGLPDHIPPRVKAPYGNLNLKHR